MTVKDLFLRCDRELLKKCFIEMEDISADEETAERIFHTLETEEAVISADEIVLGAEFINIADGLPRRIDISMYKISEIMNNFRYCALRDVNDITEREYEELNNFFSDIERYLIDLYEWRIILGFRVDENNAGQLGYERFMAEIIWSMTYYGYNEADIGRKRKEYSRVGESIRTISEEKEDTVSLNDMASLLFGDLSITAEEEEQMSLENAANMLSSYNIIREFYERNR